VALKLCGEEIAGNHPPVFSRLRHGSLGGLGWPMARPPSGGLLLGVELADLTPRVAETSARAIETFRAAPEIQGLWARVGIP
jgi:hypothetical protein